ncbi:MAG TPA: hypothetical protein VFU13_19355 [Steroidobacteraceae bacterium]|nr:hypothetical protein [Steroidobacteraceae bacterium]
MRDPLGSLSAVGDQMVRTLAGPLAADDFLNQPVARELVRDKLLVDFTREHDTRLVAPRIEWVSQPSEWCRAQLLDAALLTLDVAERAFTCGFELKDASAWNVIFDGCSPVFCDHLSFARIGRREWHALGQFARHFTLPLLLAARSSLPVHAQFRMYRDGITPELALSICGWRAWFSRAAPLMLAARGGGSAAAPRARPAASSAGSLHANLLRYCRASLPPRERVVAAANAPAADGRRGWHRYVLERGHYPDSAVARKQEIVRTWLARLQPRWVLDLGANTGEFSVLAARAGARVIAIDADHHCVERLYLDSRAQADLASAVHPVVAQLDDLCAGRGWNGSEAPGIVGRLRGHSDVVMMLGLVHHLMLACAIPAASVADFAADMTRGTAIVEVVGEGDPMFQTLAAQYARTQDAARNCGRDAQIDAFARHFTIVEQVALPDTHRSLLLLAKGSA